MGEPPRLSQILLPWEKSIIYFVILSVKGRRRVLANSRTFEAIKGTIVELNKWRVLAGVVMPDHAHFIVAATKDRGLPAGDFSNGFKRLLRKRIESQNWNWQRG